MLTSPPPPANRRYLDLQASVAPSHHSIAMSPSSSTTAPSTTTNNPQQQQKSTAPSSSSNQQPQSSGTASIIEVTALRFDVERARAIIDQKTKQVSRLESENSRLTEQLDKIRVIESDRRNNNESSLLVEIDSLKRNVRIGKDEKVALELARDSLTQKLETAERRVNVLRQFEETNALLQKDVSLKDSEINKLRREVALAEKRIQEATQQSLCNVLQGKVSALEQMVNERDNQIEELRTTCAELESALTQTRVANSELRDRGDQMDRLMSELRVATSALKSDLAANARLLESTQEEFARRYADLQTSKSHVEQRCSLLEELNSELRGEAREANRRSQDREFVITELQNELSVTRHELQAARHNAACANEDERAAVDRLKRLQQLAADREGEIAKQHLVEQSLRAELDAHKQAVGGVRSDMDRLRQELNESSRRCDLLSHQAAQREGAEERVRQMERQLQRTIEENDVMRENVALARRREVDAETILAKQREQLSMIDRLQSELEEREVRILALRREKQLADAELEAIRHDLTRARATVSPLPLIIRPQISPTGTKQVKNVSPSRHYSPPSNSSPSRPTSTSNKTSIVFGRHQTPPPTATSPIRRGISPRGAGLQKIQQQQQESLSFSSTSFSQVPPAAVRRPDIDYSYSSNNQQQNDISGSLMARRNLANANNSRSIISATVLTPERPYVPMSGEGTNNNNKNNQSGVGASRLGPRQM